MRPKGNAPPKRATQAPLQQARANRSRREVPRRPVAASGSSAAPARRASRSVDSSNARRPPPKTGARCLCATPLTENRVRRYVLSAIASQNSARLGAQLQAPRTPEQRSIFKRSSLSSKSIAPGACLSRPLGSNYPQCSSNCMNRFASSGVGPPERARFRQRKSNAWCCNDKSSSSFVASDPKSLILKKNKSSKNSVSNTLIKDHFSQFSCNNKVCIVGQVQTKFERDAKETAPENRITDIANTILSLNNERQDTIETVEGRDGDSKEVRIYDSDIPSLDTDGSSLLSRDQKSLVSHDSFTRSHESLLSPKSCESFVLSKSSLGWERVLLSLQVQVSPISSPTSSSTILEEASPLPSKLSSKTHPKFQTTSEIMVLPILASHQDKENKKLKEQVSDPGIEICPIREASMEDFLGLKRNESREDKLTDVDRSGKFDVYEDRKELDMTLPGSIEHRIRPKTTCEISDVIAATDERCETMENSKISLVCQEERSHNNTNKTFDSHGIQKNNKIVNKCSSSPPENAVAELKLNQNDIVKMAYEIIDIVSQIHVSKSPNSNTFENSEAHSELRKRSIDLSSEHSDSSNISVRTVQSIAKFSDSDTEMKRENLSSSKENTSTDNNDCKVSSNSVSNFLSEDSESETSEVIDIINTFKIPKELPMLLYQNKQVNKLLKEFAAKLEESEKDFFTLDDPKKCPSMGELKECNIGMEYEADSERNEDEMNDTPIEDKPHENDDHLNKTDTLDLKMQTTQENEIEINIQEECINIKYLQTTADQTANEGLWINDESTASEADIEKSLEVHSEADAEDGDDEATGSASEAAVEETMDLLDTSPDDPADKLVCSCKDTHKNCPRHPDKEDELILEGTCICERFQDICTEDNPTGGSQVEMKLDTEPGTQSTNNESDRVILDETASASANVSKSASWVPWVRTNGNEDGPRIPDFNPGPTDTASSITIPPHQVQNTMNLLQKQDNVSEYSSGGSTIQWVPESMKDDVPDTITEYHWMPDDVRAFSSTMICPEIPDDAPSYNPDDRPQLYVRHSYTPEPSTSGFILQTSSAKPSLIPSDAGRMTINPDAPAEVPGVNYNPGFDVSVGGTLFNVLSIAVEKSISPLKSAIEELKMKVDRMETTHMASMRPDILVGVTSVSTSQGRTGTSDSCDVHGASTCVPPFGIYILHQRPTSLSDNLPLGAGVGNAIQGSSQWPDGATRPNLPCNRCVEKLKMISTSASINSSPSGSGGNYNAVPPPSTFSSPNEASVSGGGRPSLSRVPEETAHAPRVNPEDSKYQMHPRCKCPRNMEINQAQNYQTNNARKADDFEPISENEKCTKCRICNPSENIIKSPEEFGPFLASPKCVGCCKPPYKTERPDREDRQQKVQSPDQQYRQQKEEPPKQHYIQQEGQQAIQQNAQQEINPSDQQNKLQEEKPLDHHNYQQGDEPNDQHNYQERDEPHNQQEYEPHDQYNYQERDEPHSQQRDEPHDQHNYQERDEPHNQYNDQQRDEPQQQEDDPSHQQNRKQEEQLPNQENGQQEGLPKERAEDQQISENQPERSGIRRDSHTSRQSHPSQACGTCKTCLPVDPSFDASTFKRGSFRSPSQIPCHKCCTCPLLMKKTSSELPWLRHTKCPGCSRCPYPPPCPPGPPAKPPLSPIAQMYLDMSRAKHDWSDTPKDKRDEEDVCDCSKRSCPGLVPETEGERELEEDLTSKGDHTLEGEPSEGIHPEGEFSEGQPPEGEEAEGELLEEKDSDIQQKKKCCAFMRKRKKPAEGDKKK